MEPDPPTDDRMGVRDYLRVLRRRWLLVAATTAVVTGLVVGVSLLQTPRYSASADILIEPSAQDTAISSSTEVSDEELATQVQVVRSLPVARRVRQRLELREVPSLSDMVTVEPLGTSRIIRVSASDPDPREAARVANAVANSYLAYRRSDSTRQAQRARQRLEDEQVAIEKQLASIETDLAGNPPNPAQLRAEKQQLERRFGQVSLDLARYEEAESSTRGGGQLLQRAEVAVSPTSPRPALNGALGGVFGLLLGLAVGLLRDRFADGVYDEDLARRGLGTVPILGRIPRWDDHANRDRLVTLLHPYAPATEAFQTLSVNVRFLLAAHASERQGGVVLTTSAQPTEGKTVTACNLAVAATRIGMRVLLIDGDLRRGGMAGRFGLGELRGLSDALVRGNDPNDYLVDVGVDGLRMLPAGTVPPNPTQLLGSARMRGLLEQLTPAYDLVVVDGAPVLAVADSLELAARADLVLLVVRTGVSRRRSVSSAVESLQQVGVSSISGVLNCLDTGDAAVVGYGYAPRGVEQMQAEQAQDVRAQDVRAQDDDQSAAAEPEDVPPVRRPAR